MAYEISKKLIQDYPGLKGIFANTTSGTIGIGMAVRDTGTNGDIVAISYDTQIETRNLLDDCSLLATVTQNPFHQGYYAVKLMHKILFENYRPDREFYYTKADIIANSAQFDLNTSSIQI
jgi:ABC-type sugar transport system substrate-binding protein